MLLAGVQINLGGRPPCKLCWVSYFPDPCVREDGEHKLCRLPSRGFKGGAVRAPCLVCGLLSRPDDGRSVIVDLEIVCPEPLGFGEGFAVAFNVCALRPNDADEIVLHSRFVLQDFQEGRGNSLPKSGEVGVQRLLRDRLEVIDRCSEFRDDLVWSYPAPGEM